MNKVLRKWKKVYETDLGYIVYELKELVTEACVIFLEGELAAGKTTFTKYFLAPDSTLSPTYSILSDSGDLLHGDFYRIESVEEIDHLELTLHIQNKKYFFAEWAMKYADAIVRELPDDFNYYRLDITINESQDHQEASRNFVLTELDFDI